MVEANPECYSALAQADLLADGKETWGPMALAGDRLVLRDLRRLICVDMSSI